MTLLRPLHIGPVVAPNNLLLAPLAGITSLPFRRMAKRFGAGVVVSEMLSANATVQGSIKTHAMAAIADDERPVGIQLAGSDPEMLAEAARIHADLNPDFIDIHMGCPVKKVVKGLAGSALLRDELLVGRICAATVKASPLPVTLKVRLGWDEASINIHRIARIAEESGIAMLTVHGRTRAQMFSGRANWQIIGEVAAARSIPVIGNGDVASPEDAEALLKTGVAGVMIGRAALGRPWLFGQILAHLQGQPVPADPTPAQRVELMARLFDDLKIHHGERIGLMLARKFAAWLTHGLPGSGALRQAIHHAPDWASLTALLEEARDRLEGETA